MFRLIKKVARKILDTLWPRVYKGGCITPSHVLGEEMAKGNQVIPVRINPEILALINEAIASRNERTSDIPFTLSQWIRAAIMEKLAHLQRSKRNRWQIDDKENQ